MPTNSTPEQVVKAQGWVINNLGEVILTEDCTYRHTPYSLDDSSYLSWVLDEWQQDQDDWSRARFQMRVTL